jgi:hypothetical protein
MGREVGLPGARAGDRVANGKRGRWKWLLGVTVVAVAVGCLSSDSSARWWKPEPKPPTFAEKVADVESGLTTREQIERWFGAPTSVVEFEDDSVAWVFRHTQPMTEEGVERCKPPERPNMWRRVGSFFDRLFYPPRPPIRPVSRRYPARIHELGLILTPDGVVDDLRYQHSEGVIFCTS